MFINGGEEPGGETRCPGEGKCDRWSNAAGDYEEKALACKGCDQNCLPPLQSDDEIAEDEELQDLVDEIAYIAAWEDAGIATDWSAYAFTTQQLYVVWREAERQVREIRAVRHAAYVKGMMTAPQLTPGV